MQMVGDTFPPATLERLREIKLRYDPDNFFRDDFNIDPRPDGRTVSIKVSDSEGRISHD
ncbi:hypothetical protein SRB5_13470 [Streptomyces sp. RB5]|uniref:Berberine/berberine-like domain-containing protein n=1 Tax=Streptomyces smaragdinus TaxID=2585196 RepID=A0A7K0CDS9_9ACTN|nr:BBE domain-containing protein [Streptomyces smaragdinus]MQY11232.1 hypothetical protein [Streptomyces smaragdinus]